MVRSTCFASTGREIENRAENADKGRRCALEILRELIRIDVVHNEIHEDAQGNVFVKNLSMIPVRTAEEVDEIVQMGLKLRATHETRMNSVSSRSHTIFSINVLQQSKNIRMIRLIQQLTW